jgi:hypothetical protein
LPQIPVVLSEWTDYNPKCTSNVAQCLTGLQSKKELPKVMPKIHAGHFKTKFNNEWKRMLAMDVSDIYYDKFN